MQMYDENMKLVIEAGTFEVMIGSSSVSYLKESFEVHETPEQGMAVGAVIGIVIGVIVVLALAVVGVMFFMKKNKKTYASLDEKP